MNQAYPVLFRMFLFFSVVTGPLSVNSGLCSGYPTLYIFVFKESATKNIKSWVWRTANLDDFSDLKREPFQKGFRMSLFFMGISFPTLCFHFFLFYLSLFFNEPMVKIKVLKKKSITYCCATLPFEMLYFSGYDLLK